MFFRIDHSSGVPIYRQIMEQIKYSMAKGSLRPGDRLPSVRQLSVELEVNPNTIAKAWSELEHEKMIETRRGMGTFVTDSKIEISREIKVKTITKLAERLAVEAVHLDMDRNELLQIINGTIDRFYSVVESGDES